MSSKVLRLIVLCILAPSSFVAWSSSVKGKSLAQITDETDVWVRGHVLSVETRPLPENERYKFNFHGQVEIKAVVSVDDAVPPINDKEITIHYATLDELPARIAKDKPFITALTRNADGTYRSVWAFGFFGWYQPSDTSVGEYKNSPIGDTSGDLLWELVTTLRTAPDMSGAALTTVRDKWLARLESGTLAEFAAARIVFDAFPKLELSSNTLFAALERQYEAGQQRAAAMEQPYEELQSLRGPLTKALSLLPRDCNSDVVKRLVELSKRDFTAEHSVFDQMEVPSEILRVILACGGENRTELVNEFLGKPFEWSSVDGKRNGIRLPLKIDYRALQTMTEQPGDDIDNFLLRMLHTPSDFGVQTNSSAIGCLWNALATRGNPAIKKYLNSFLANPAAPEFAHFPVNSREQLTIFARESMEIYTRTLPHAERMQEDIRLARNGDLNALDRALRHATKEDVRYIPEFAAIPQSSLTSTKTNVADAFAMMAGTALPDPSFLPQLRALAKSNKGASVFVALKACGDESLARSLALEFLARPPTGTNTSGVSHDVQNRMGTLTFLSSFHDPELFAEIDRYTRTELLDAFRTKSEAVAKTDKKEFANYQVSALERTAILALASTGVGTIPRLKEIFADGDIGARIVAAMGLYALGDDTGNDIVQKFAEHRELEDSEIAARWRIDLIGVFHDAARLLENPRIDTVVLERIKRGMDDSDHNISSYKTFVETNKGIVLEALLINLESRNPRLRTDAARLLEGITNEKSKYDPDVLPRNQQDAIQQWSSRVAAIVAKS